MTDQQLRNTPSNLIDHVAFSKLTPAQRRYVLNRMMGMTTKMAAQNAGSSNPYRDSQSWEAREDIKAMVQGFYAQAVKEFEITRNDVIRGILDAIEVATIQAEALTMMTGWEKLARVCGLMEPERKELVLSVQGAHTQQQIAMLDEHALLELVGKERQLIEDVEYEEVPHVRAIPLENRNQKAQREREDSATDEADYREALYNRLGGPSVQA